MGLGSTCMGQCVAESSCFLTSWCKWIQPLVLYELACVHLLYLIKCSVVVVWKPVAVVGSELEEAFSLIAGFSHSQLHKW